jgi:hypothetical protein
MSRNYYLNNKEKVNAKAKAWKLANPEKVKETNRQYRLKHKKELTAYNLEWTKNNPEKVKQIQRRFNVKTNWKRNKIFRDKHPEKESAWDAVKYALKKSKLTKLSCKKCGETKTHAHHYLGYQPIHRLDVEWLCALHHKEAHYA